MYLSSMNVFLVGCIILMHQFYFHLSTGAVFLAMLTNWRLQVLGSGLWQAP